MPTEPEVSFEEKLKDPRAHFDSPAAVLAAADLTDEARLKLLRRWELDERALVRAGSESPMTDGEQPILTEVQDAIRRIEGGDGRS